MSDKRLIVSADDFGMSPGVNAGILRAHREGILTNASLMVSGAAFDEAVALAGDAPSLGVGLHLVLVQGRATAPPASVPGLVDGAGFFADHPIASGLRYFFRPGLRPQLAIEIRAQLEKFRATGLALSHVDGHLNLHMHPVVLPLLLALAPEIDVGAVRLSREPLFDALRFDRRHWLRKSFETVVFRGLSAHARGMLDAAAIRYPQRMYGLHQTGHVTEEYLLHVIPRLPDGVSEIYCHAALTDAEASRWRPADYRGEDELRALTSERVREALERHDVKLTTYRELWSEAATRAG